MLKLYKKVDDKIHYWETWEKDKKKGVIHWGIVGERGTQRQVFSGIFSGFEKIIQKEINKLLKEGYDEVDSDNHYTLLIEYNVEGMGSEEDMEKRHRLENKMDQTLGWTGLGHSDGGSIGSGTMEVSCFVVDFEIAKNVIIQDLKGTEFENYTRIFNEN